MVPRELLVLCTFSECAAGVFFYLRSAAREDFVWSLLIFWNGTQDFYGSDIALVEVNPSEERDSAVTGARRV